MVNYLNMFCLSFIIYGLIEDRNKYLYLHDDTIVNSYKKITKNYIKTLIQTKRENDKIVTKE